MHFFMNMVILSEFPLSTLFGTWCHIMNPLLQRAKDLWPPGPDLAQSSFPLSGK